MMNTIQKSYQQRTVTTSRRGSNRPLVTLFIGSPIELMPSQIHCPTY